MPKKMEDLTGRRFGRLVVQRFAVTLGGKEVTIAQLAESTGIAAGTLAQRLNAGWSVEKAASHPVRSWGR